MSMREKYDTTFGKYDRPFTRYLYECVILNGFSDDFASDGDGEWCERVGRRVIAGDNRGFIWTVRTCKTDQEAIELFVAITLKDFMQGDDEDADED